MGNVKIRTHEESNYKAVYFNNTTVRLKLDNRKPITELKYPEFYDVKITGHCTGGCPYCYMDSKSSDSHYEDICQKMVDYFGVMTPNQRPFSVAIGGGEPTSHPDFVDFLIVCSNLGITPNYTTNGMFMFQENWSEILDATEKYSGGVAVSCHPHLEKSWTLAAEYFLSRKIKLNFHHVISDRKSIDDFLAIYKMYKGEVAYFVLLPYGATGRAEPREIDWEYLEKSFPKDMKDIAFGANFYYNLINDPEKYKVSIYEPEILSKFIDMKDMTVYNSSFDLTPLNN